MNIELMCRRENKRYCQSAVLKTFSKEVLVCWQIYVLISPTKLST